jgi:hypothetical protein
MVFHIRQFWSLLPGAAIALAVAICSTNSAKAECGDYVRIGSESIHHPMLPSHSGPAQPCHGPSCQNRPEAPLIPPAPPPAPVNDLYCSIALTQVPSPLRCGWTVFDDWTFSAIFSNDIFHPPK